MAFDLTSGKAIPDAPEDEEPDEGEAPEFEPLCIWCGAPWNDDNVRLSALCDGCESGGYDHGAKIEIVCHSCGKLMYEKEDWGY